MVRKSNLPHLSALLCLSGPCALRLSELAVDWDLTMQEAAQAAIHIAYLDHLAKKSDEAANELHRLFDRGYRDDELPF